MSRILKILIISGHGQGDPGATYHGLEEQNITRELANILAKCFGNANAIITIYDQSKNAYKQLQAGNIINFKNYDYVIELHTNANSNDRARGCGFYLHVTEEGISVEEKILDNLIKLGLTKWGSGVYRRDDLLVQNKCKEAKVSHGLLEVFFISNKEDVAFYQSHKKEIGQAIADGIIDGFGIRKIEIVDEYSSWIGSVANAEKLNVRVGPGMKYSIVSVIGQINVEIFGEAYEDIEKTKKWYNIKVGDNVLGWVYSKYIKMI